MFRFHCPNYVALNSFQSLQLVSLFPKTCLLLLRKPGGGSLPSLPPFAHGLMPLRRLSVFGKQSLGSSHCPTSVQIDPIRPRSVLHTLGRSFNTVPPTLSHKKWCLCDVSFRCMEMSSKVLDQAPKLKTYSFETLVSQSSALVGVGYGMASL